LDSGAPPRFIKWCVPSTPREEAVQGRCRCLSAGRRARRLRPCDSSGRFSGGDSGAEIIFGPPLDGRSQPTPERLRRRLCLATWTRSAAANARLCRGFPGMNRLRKRPADAGALRLLDVGLTKGSIFPPEPPLLLPCADATHLAQEERRRAVPGTSGAGPYFRLYRGRGGARLGRKSSKTGTMEHWNSGDRLFVSVGDCAWRPPIPCCPT
jgi:hypothetical protein